MKIASERRNTYKRESGTAATETAAPLYICRYLHMATGKNDIRKTERAARRGDTTAKDKPQGNIKTRRQGKAPQNAK